MLTHSLVFVVFNRLTLEASLNRSLIDTVDLKKEQEMAWIIFLLIIGLPVLELTVLIDVGDEIGAFNTVLMCLLTAGIGLSLVRMQGMKVFQDMQVRASAGEPVGDNLIHGFFLLIAGVCLFIPGFITDTFGALLLVPFFRLALGKAGMAHMVVKSYRTPNRGAQEDIIIDGEYSRYEEKQETDQTVEIEVIPPHKPTEKD